MDKIKVDELKQLCAANDINHRNMDGATLRALRLKLGLTQTQMGEKLGITASAITHLESGKNTMSKPVAMLAQRLHSELLIPPANP